MASKPTAKVPKNFDTKARSGKKFTAEWAPANNYTDQKIQFGIKYGNKWYHSPAIDLGKSTSSKAFYFTENGLSVFNNGDPKLPASHKKDANKAPWWPKGESHLQQVGARLKCKTKDGWSDWGNWAKFDILNPEAPKAVRCTEDSRENTYVWEWVVPASNTSTTTTHWRTYYEWRTCLVGPGEQPNWSRLDASDQRIVRITTGDTEDLQDNKPYGQFASATKVIIVEDAASITAGKRRWFQVRSLGPQGSSSYCDAFAYDLGNNNEIDVAPEDVDYSGSTSTGTSFVVPIPAYNAVVGDKVRVDYAITNPYVSATTDGTWFRSTMSLPNGFNEWQSTPDITANGNAQYITVDVPYYVGENQRLFARVVTTHDSKEAAGAPFLLEDGVGVLSAPILKSFSANEKTQELTVTVQNTATLATGGNNSFIGIFCRTEANPNPTSPIGIIPYSEGEVSRTFQASWPDGATVSVGVRCYVADYTPLSPSATGVTYYTIDNVRMMSNTDWDQTTTATLPQQPRHVRVSRANVGDDGLAALVEWDWSWRDANMAEISWSTNRFAWESTEEPSSFTLSDTRVGRRYVTGLSADTYWFRVRLIRSEGDTMTYGTYSDAIPQSFSSAPNKPTLTFSLDTIPPVAALNDEVTVYWGYETNDGTGQTEARFAEAVLQDNVWTYNEITNAVVGTAQQFTFTPASLGWTEGSSHYLCVKVRSGSGEWCDWSNPAQAAYLQVAALPTIEVTGIGTSASDPYPLRPVDVIVDPEDDTLNLHIPLALTEMPLTFNVAGMGAGGYATVIIERVGNGEQERPDDSNATVFDGETIFSGTFELPDATSTSADVSIDLGALVEGTHLDHMSPYRLYISITDHYGQTVSHDPYDFVVYWNSFAEIPTADVVLDEEDGVAYVTPRASSVNEGDYCQIYRLSADKPQLILDNGTFGTTYVDRYPTYGQFGGYRIVYITKYGDYRTSENINAWADYSYREGNMPKLDRFLVTINFGDDIVEVKGNVRLSHSWAKDFQQTRYLGGSIEGDWNPGVERSGSIDGALAVEEESDALYLIRRLADFPGICHVRTPEGSNFYADIQVKDDREEKFVNKIAKVSLSYTKVRGTENEMPTLADWTEE